MKVRPAYKRILFSAFCLMALCVQAYEKVHFTENGLVYSSVLPAACGHYLGRHDSTDVIICGYESPEIQTMLAANFADEASADSNE